MFTSLATNAAAAQQESYLEQYRVPLPVCLPGEFNTGARAANGLLDPLVQAWHACQP